MAIHIVLIEPEIPQNTGNIARTCAALQIDLHIVGTIPFVISERNVKRAGLDYWPYVQLHRHETISSFFSQYPAEYCVFTSSHASQHYVDYPYPDDTKDCFLVFGKESNGLSKEFLDQYHTQSVRIPMRKEVRSLNLANSVAILAYHVAALQGFRCIL